MDYEASRICEMLISTRSSLGTYHGRLRWERKNEGKYSIENLPQTAKNEWVICRVFQKRADGTKVPMSMLDPHINRIEPTGLPSLIDCSQRDSFIGSSSHVTCFSDQETEDKRLVHESKEGFGSLFYSDPLFLQDNYSLMKLLLDGQEPQFPGRSFDGRDPSGLAGTEELDCVWNF
ncbi:unnamed protein product [Arabidopsis arenosa]|uniref:NAC domain-containing protein n=1 Tax=Arabidopsis arenosa TaxID=38785 RepID=A0A8S2B0P2_ARAAE|nr:unnamed protein product [Arabidopsis arenosa]